MGAVKKFRKNGEWEKNRRERLNLTFYELSQQLPDHDPTLSLTKVEILIRSIAYIKDLREKNASLVESNCSETLKSEMTLLQKQVDELRRRNQQLAELLRTAEIPLPPRPCLGPLSLPFTPPRKWTGKIAKFDIQEKKKGNTKENPENLSAVSKTSVAKKISKVKKKCKTKSVKQQETEASKSSGAVVSSSIAPLREINNASSGSQEGAKSLNQESSVSRSGVKNAAVPVCGASANVQSATVPVSCTSVQTASVLSRTVTLPCTTISLVLSNPKTNVVTVAKSNVLPAPIMATGIQPVLQRNPNLSTLGPGTLIMADGRIVPVPPPAPTVLAVVNRPAPPPALILLPPTTQGAPTTHKLHGSLRPIVPKPRQRDTTKTTFVNKVPIPAISSQSHVACVKSKTVINKDVKKNTKKKTVVSKPNVVEKCVDGEPNNQTAANKSECGVLPENIIKQMVNQLNKVCENGKSKVSDDNITSSKANKLKKDDKIGQCVTKRKIDDSNENSNGAKLARVAKDTINNSVSDKTLNNSNKDTVNQLIQDNATDIELRLGTTGSSSNSENVTKDKELERNKDKFNDNTEGNCINNRGKSECENGNNIQDSECNSVDTDKRINSNTNTIVSENKINNNATLKNVSCNISDHCGLNTNPQSPVIRNLNFEQVAEKEPCTKSNPKENSTNSSVINCNTNNTGQRESKTRSCVISDKTQACITDGFNFNKAGQKIPEVALGSVVKNSHVEIHGISQSSQNPISDGIIFSEDRQHMLKTSINGNAKETSPSLTVNESRLKDECQQVLKTSISNTANKVVDSSVKISNDFGLTGPQVLNRNNTTENNTSTNTNILHFDANSHSVFKTNIGVNVKQININSAPNTSSYNKTGNQVTTANGCGRGRSDDSHSQVDSLQISNLNNESSVNRIFHTVPSVDSLNCDLRNNPGDFSGHTNFSGNIYKSDQSSSSGQFPPNDSCKISNTNVNNSTNKNGRNNPRDIIVMSDQQQSSNTNVCCSEGKFSQNPLLGNSHVSSNSQLNSEVKISSSTSKMVAITTNDGSKACHTAQQHPVQGLSKTVNNVISNSSQQTSITNVGVNKTSHNPNSNTYNFQNPSINSSGIANKNFQITNSESFCFNENVQQNLSINIGIENKLPQNSTSNTFHTVGNHPNRNTSLNMNSNKNVNSCTSNISISEARKHNLSGISNVATNNNAQNQTDGNLHHNNRSQQTPKTNINTNVHGQNPNTNNIHFKDSKQNNLSMSVDVSINKNTQNSTPDNFNFLNNQQTVKTVENSSKPHPEMTKTLITQSSKSTQVTSFQLTYTENAKHQAEIKQQVLKQNIVTNDTKKSMDIIKHNNCENKSLIQDDSQELTSLFPTDPKLQSCSENLFRDADFRDRNLFMPVSHSYMDEMRLNLPHSDFSNDLFSSLQVPTAGQHPESISPTAAFLLAFPLVSTSKTSELITENEGGESQHVTPTTILQIGNIDPPSNELFHQTALMIENNVNKLQDTIKHNKPADTNKTNSTKQLKEIDNFNKFQQMEINELMRTENFSRNHCKEKKNFLGLHEQDMFLPCTKKKPNGRNNNYPMPSSVISHFQEKPFEFSENNVRNSAEQDRQVNNTGTEQKKNHTRENLSNTQNLYNISSQSYPYNSFSSGNEFSPSNSTYIASNNVPVGVENTKSTSIATSNFNVISWSTASITATTNQIDYTTPYCSYPQKPYTNPNKNTSHKSNPNNFEEQRIKEKSTSNTNALPKFSNFQFNNNSHPNLDIQNYSQTNQTDNSNYKAESKAKKQKTGSQRAPVNWMTTPDIRPLLPDTNVAPMLPEAMFQHQKDMGFSSTPNNVMMLSTSSNITPFNISSSSSNNPQTFYPNSHFSGVDLQLDFAPFPEIPSNKPSRNLTSVPSSQQNPHHYSWSPSKSSIPLLPHIDSHMIPSTLPTLVGDLALGTTTPSGPVDSFRNLSMPTTPFNIETPLKKCDRKFESQKPVNKSHEKDCFPNSERRNRTIADYCQKTHSHQGTNTSSSFLSVSQLVDQVKTEQNPSSRRATKPSLYKNSTSGQKRNPNTQQTDKSNHAKLSNNVNSSCHPPNPINPAMMSRKPDLHPVGYQEIQNTGMGFPGTFGNQVGAPPWQNDKPHRSTNHYKGNYSAEALIADQSTPTQDHVPELPQFPNQYNHPPVVSSASYPSADFSHQNVQPLEFHQTHQHSFNFAHNSHYSSTSFNAEGDYHLGLDPLYNFNPGSNKNSVPCQTSAKDNRSLSNKRGQSNKQRREEFTPQWTPQVYPSSVRTKCPPQCPSSSSSLGHQGTTTLTNFNLSTIFPEINDKQVGLPGPPPPSHFPSASNFRPH